MEKKYNVVVVDDQYVSRSFFEIHVRMSKGYDLAASLSSAELIADAVAEETGSGLVQSYAELIGVLKAHSR